MADQVTNAVCDLFLEDGSSTGGDFPNSVFAELIFEVADALIENVTADLTLQAASDDNLVAFADLTFQDGSATGADFTENATADLNLDVDAEEFVADTVLDRFELHVGTDERALRAELGTGNRTPDETFAALPHTTALALPDGLHFAVVQKRSIYNLFSNNVLATRIFVESAAAENRPPATPFMVRLSQITISPTDFQLRIRAWYFEKQDDNAATEWLVFFTRTGVDPILATPTVVTMQAKPTRGVRELVHIVANLDAGNLTRVKVKTRRVDAGPVNRGSAASVERTLAISSDAPRAPAKKGVDYQEYGSP